MALHSDRGGHLATQSGGSASEYKAFVPKPLPPAIVVSDELTMWDRRAHANLGLLRGITRVLPNPELFLYMYVRKEAVLSSQIEGTQSSLSDLLMFEHASAPTVPEHDVREVSRYVAAAGLSVELLQRLPLSMRLLREVHAVLLTDARGNDKTPGEIRTSQNWIGGSKPGDALFVPPPHEVVLDCLGSLEHFIHREDEHLSPIFKAGLVHAQFETIHPFLDGNGRLGRLLIPLVLMHEGVLDAPVFYPSLYFKERRQEYYERLQQTRTHGAWEDWLLFFVKGIAIAAETAATTVAAAHALFERDRQRIAALGERNVANTLRIFDHVRERAVISVPDICVALSLSPPTVNSAVKSLQILNIVREVTGKARDRRYMYDAYVKILSDDPPHRP
jgi:Fic family protein